MRVSWTRAAGRDLDGMWDHIEADEPDACGGKADAAPRARDQAALPARSPAAQAVAGS